MTDRFYSAGDFTAGTVELTGPETHHLTHVMRKRAGQSIVVFNGRGKEATGEILETNRRRTVIRLCDVRELPPLPGPHITLAVAVPKHDRFRWLAEKAMELGVNRLVPLKTERGIVEPGGGKLDKIRRAVIEAAKQCGAGWLTEVSELSTWADFVGESFPANDRVYIAQPGGSPLAVAAAHVVPDDSLCFLIGPEGGFTDAEAEQATSAGAVSVDLGPQTLRIETAAIAVAAWARLSGVREPRSRSLTSDL